MEDCEEQKLKKQTDAEFDRLRRESKAGQKEEKPVLDVLKTERENSSLLGRLEMLESKVDNGLRANYDSITQIKQDFDTFAQSINKQLEAIRAFIGMPG